MKKLLLLILLIPLAFFLYTRLKPSSPASTTCSLSPCHGLDLTCATTSPKVCTLDYQLGDRCRQFASCQVQNNRCQLITDPKFASCHSCVQNCQQQYSEDVLGLNQCESTCTD